MPKHAAVWFEHEDARIFHILRDSPDGSVASAPLESVHHERSAGPEGGRRQPPSAEQFFGEVARSLDGLEQILVVGASTAKLEFLRYVHRHEVGLEPKIVGFETIDRRTDGQLVAYAKRYFDL